MHGILGVKNGFRPLLRDQREIASGIFERLLQDLVFLLDPFVGLAQGLDLAARCGKDEVGPQRQILRRIRGRVVVSVVV